MAAWARWGPRSEAMYGWAPPLAATATEALLPFEDSHRSPNPGRVPEQAVAGRGGHRHAAVLNQFDEHVLSLQSAVFSQQWRRTFRWVGCVDGARAASNAAQQRQFDSQQPHVDDGHG